jgi:hypothetical protein
MQKIYFLFPYFATVIIVQPQNYFFNILMPALCANYFLCLFKAVGQATLKALCPQQPQNRLYAAFPAHKVSVGKQTFHLFKK